MTKMYTLSLHDALPIYDMLRLASEKSREIAKNRNPEADKVKKEWESKGATPIVKEFENKYESKSETGAENRSEEHTSELQSPCNLVCRLLLQKKKKTQK